MCASTATTFYLEEEGYVKCREYLRKDEYRRITERLLSSLLEDINRLQHSVAIGIEPLLIDAINYLRGRWIIVVNMSESDLENVCSILRRLYSEGITKCKIPYLNVYLQCLLRELHDRLLLFQYIRRDGEFSRPNTFITLMEDHDIGEVLRPPLVPAKVRVMPKMVETERESEVLVVESGRHCPGVAPLFAFFVRNPNIDITLPRAIELSRTFTIAYPSRRLRGLAALYLHADTLRGEVEMLADVARNSFALYTSLYRRGAFLALAQNLTVAMNIASRESDLLRMGIDVYIAPIDAEIRRAVGLSSPAVPYIGMSFVMWTIGTVINMYRAGLIEV